MTYQPLLKLAKAEVIRGGAEIDITNFEPFDERAILLGRQTVFLANPQHNRTSLEHHFFGLTEAWALHRL